MDKVGVLNFTDDDGSTYVIEISTFSDGEGDKKEKPGKSLEEVNRSEEVSYSCDGCDNNFLTLKDLRAHLKSHCKSKKINYTCSVCSFGCTTKNGIRYHVKKHEKPNAMVCSYCGSVFSRRFHLKAHLKQHHSTVFSCKSCDFVTWDLTLLQQHVASVHEIQRYACDICTFTTSRANRYLAHKKTHPKDEPVFDYSRIRSKQIRVYSRPTKVKQEPAS